MKDNEVDIGIITEIKLRKEDKLKISGHMTIRKKEMSGKGRRGRT